MKRTKKLIEVEPTNPELFRQSFPRQTGKRAWWVKYQGKVPQLPEDCIRVLIEGCKNAQTWHRSNWKVKQPTVCPHCGEEIRLEPIL